MNQLKLLAVLSAISLEVLSGSRAKAQATFQGNYLYVGVAGNGSLINNGVGIQYDSTGTGNFAVNDDIITPGNPYQYYSLGYNGTYGSASFDNGTNFTNLSTVDTSSGDTYQAVTTGNYGNLAFTQTLTMADNSTILNYSVTLTNTGSTTLSNVVYSTGLDPDPDYNEYSTYYTVNELVSSSVVQGYGPRTGNTIALQDLTGTALVSIDPGDWWLDYDPLIAATTGFNGGLVGNDPADIGQQQNGDHAIDAGWSIGDLAAGASATIGYNYIVNETPITSTSPILGIGVPDTASTAALIVGGIAGLALLSRRRLLA